MRRLKGDVEKTQLFAKAFPLCKRRALSLPSGRHVVGFVGDINDAAAMRSSDAVSIGLPLLTWQRVRRYHLEVCW